MNQDSVLYSQIKAQDWRGTKSDCLKSGLKFPQSAMCAAAGVSQFCFPKITITASVYQEVLKNSLRPTVEEMFRDEDPIQTMNERKQDPRAPVAWQLVRSQSHGELVRKLSSEGCRNNWCSNL